MSVARERRGKAPDRWQTRHMLLAVVGLLAVAMLTVPCLAGARVLGAGYASPVRSDGDRVMLARPATPTDEVKDATLPVVPATDRARQENLLNKYCTQPGRATCFFALTSAVQRTSGRGSLVGDQLENCRGTSAHEVKRTDEVESTDTFGGSVGGELGKTVKIGIEASYEHSVSLKDSASVADVVHLEPFTVGAIYRAAPMIRSTGNLIIRTPDTNPDANAWELKDVTFTLPDTAPTAHGQVMVTSRPMTAAERTGCPALERARAARATSGLGSAGASAAAPTSAAAAPTVTAAANPRPDATGEDVDVIGMQNLTPYPLRVVQVLGSYDARFGGPGDGWDRTFGPSFLYPGEIIAPGRWVYWDLAREGPSRARVEYSVGDRGRVEVVVNSNGSAIPKIGYSCHSLDSAWDCGTIASTHQSQIFAHTTEHIVVPSSEKQRQIDMLQELCQEGNGLTCTFTPTGPIKKVSTEAPWTQLGDSQANYSQLESEHTVSREHTTTTSDSLSGEVSLSGGVEHVFQVGIKGKYGHEWTRSTSTEVTDTVNVEPGKVGSISTRARGLLEASGNFNIAEFGRTTVTIEGFTAYGPDPQPGLLKPAQQTDSREMTEYERTHPPAAGG